MSDKLAIEGGTPVRLVPLPFISPGASVYGEEEKRAVIEVINSKSPFRYYGPNLLNKTKAFEKALAEKIYNEYVVAVTSGTAALVVALKAAGIGPGDKVIVPGVTFLATPGAVVCAGAVPVFADCDDSMNIDPDAIGKVVDKYTKALIVVPILGNPCQMDRIVEVAKRYNLILIEDVAQSMGSMYKGKYSGSFGDIGCFSLQFNKTLTTGEGGAISTNNPIYYERAVRYHDQGMFREKEGFLTNNVDENLMIGQNYRMSEITGAVALEQLKKLDSLIAKMRKMKYTIKNEIKNIPSISFRRINDEAGDSANALIMLLDDAKLVNKFCSALSAENIPVSSLYGGRPVYMLPQIFYQKTVDKNNFPFNQFDEKIEYTEDMCPFSKNYMPRNVMISMGPHFTEKDVEDIILGIIKVSKALL